MKRVAILFCFLVFAVSAARAQESKTAAPEDVAVHAGKVPTYARKIRRGSAHLDRERKPSGTPKSANNPRRKNTSRGLAFFPG